MDWLGLQNGSKSNSGLEPPLLGCNYLQESPVTDLTVLLAIERNRNAITAMYVDVTSRDVMAGACLRQADN